MFIRREKKTELGLHALLFFTCSYVLKPPGFLACKRNSELQNAPFKSTAVEQIDLHVDACLVFLMPAVLSAFGSCSSMTDLSSGKNKTKRRLPAFYTLLPAAVTDHTTAKVSILTRDWFLQTYLLSANNLSSARWKTTRFLSTYTMEFYMQVNMSCCFLVSVAISVCFFCTFFHISNKNLGLL